MTIPCLVLFGCQTSRVAETELSSDQEDLDIRRETFKLWPQLADTIKWGLLCAVLGVLPLPAEAQAPPLRALPFEPADVLKAHKLSGFKAEIAHLVFAAEHRGDIAFEASAQALPGSGTDVYVPLVVEVDGLSFLSQNQAADLWLEVYAYAISQDRSVVGHLSEAVAIDIATMGEELARGGLKLFGHLELPSGEYELRVLVRNPQSKAFGIRTLALDTTARLVAIFPESEPRWLSAVESHSGSSAIDADYPFLLGGRALNPASRPVLAAGRNAGVVLLGRDMTGLFAGKARFLDASGSSTSSDILVEGTPAASARGLEALTVRFRPPELPAGEYRVVFELKGQERGRGSWATQEIPIWLTAGDARERDLLWTDLRWMIESVRPATPRPAPAAQDEASPEARIRPALQASGGRQRRRIRRAAESYRAALTTLVGKPLAEGRQVLFELESDVLGRGSGRLTELRVGEVRLAEELAAEDPESLVPMLATHLELYRLYRGRRLSLLLSHSRLLLEAQAEIYAAAGGDPTLAADVLACLGGELQQADLTASSQRLFGRALVHDPTNLGALLGLAISFERYSRYQDAVAILENLVESHPKHAEGQLRLAINLDRLGLRRRSLEILESLLQADKPPWIATLTTQQLSRRYLEIGQLAEAERVLTESVQQYPTESGLRLMLAYFYDRQRRPLKSLEVLGGLSPSPPTGEGSAVKIYDGWPRTALERARRNLARQAERQRDVLAKGVAR